MPTALEFRLHAQKKILRDIIQGNTGDSVTITAKEPFNYFLPHPSGAVVERINGIRFLNNKVTTQEYAWSEDDVRPECIINKPAAKFGHAGQIIIERSTDCWNPPNFVGLHSGAFWLNNQGFICLQMECDCWCAHPCGGIVFAIGNKIFIHDGGVASLMQHQKWESLAPHPWGILVVSGYTIRLIVYKNPKISPCF